MTNKKWMQTSVALIIMTLSFSVSAAESATERLNSFVKNVVTFKAKFSQTVVDERGQVLEEAEGFFILERPGKFRWDYKLPYPQHIVADGQRIWFYDVDLEQVTVKSQLDALADTPATLLSGRTKPEDKYLLTDIPSDDGLAWVELIPKDIDSNFQTVTLAFDQYGLSQMIMKDSFDQQTRLMFSQTSENSELMADVFIFTPPLGVDVVGETGL
ncbi:MAG: outer membrane lipoprotein chaperone LolA [Gammaproteobacteria bacterium]|nr:outer membrane lipoprotein chaperone LolA [Gammaproteobacteria bacterium]